jgi:hypothetical protein
VIEQVDKFERTSDFHGVARIFWTVTPAVQFAAIVWETAQWPGILLMNVRKPFDEGMAIALMHHVNRIWDGKVNGRGMVLLPGLQLPPPQKMDRAVLLSGQFLQKVGTVDPSLDANTVVVFPAYDGEFTGTESPDEFDEVIHTVSDIGDWSRTRRKA